MKMKIAKMAAIMMFATLFATNANAQTVKYPKVHFGIRLGGTFNSISTSGFESEYEEKRYGGETWPTGGLAFDFRIAQIPLYMETGLYYVNRSVNDNEGYDERDHGVELPLVLSYHHYIADKVAIQPFAGGFVGVGNETSYGVRLGCGINYGRLYANVGYDIDLAEKEISDWRGYSYGNYKMSGLFATIGFNFGGAR